MLLSERWKCCDGKEEKEGQQWKQKSSAQSPQPLNFSGFMKMAWAIILNKKDTERHFTSMALSFMISLCLNLIAGLLALVALFGLCTGLYEAICNISTSFSETVNGLTQVLIAAIMAMFALVLRGVANETERETDVNHLVALFSGITGFAALIATILLA